MEPEWKIFNMMEWLKVATEPSVVWRALKCAVIVGAILIMINYGDVILDGDINATRLLKMGLTVIVPYFVSTASSVSAIRKFHDKN